VKKSQVGVAILTLGVLILALLASGLAGVAVHHGDRDVVVPQAGAGKTAPTVTGPTTTATTVAPAPVTPAGFRRVTDTVDHLSVAVPSSWRTPVLTAGSVNAQLKAYAVKDPQLAPLINAALSAAGKIDLGLFAADPTTRRVLYIYGIDVPAGTTTDSIPLPVAELTALGAKNIESSQLQLPVGKADQVSLQLLVKNVTVSQIADFFVLGTRLVYAVLATPGSQPDASVFRQIQQTVQAGG
jgi:hypothetical protein